LKRLLGFILLLLGPRKYNREELQERFIISKSTFHRYIKILKDCGILVAQNQGFYQIIKIEPEFKELSELLHFSEEEAQILNSAILSIDDNNSLKYNLIKKIYSNLLELKFQNKGTLEHKKEARSFKAGIEIEKDILESIRPPKLLEQNIFVLHKNYNSELDLLFGQNDKLHFYSQIL